MNMTIDATYENGVFKLTQPLPLQEHEKVKLTVHTQASPLLAAHGIMGWTGSQESADYFAMHSEFDPQED